MLPKKNRTTKKEVENLFKRGSTLHGSVLFLKYTLQKEDFAKKVSFVAPKKLEKRAFHRNTLKRAGYNALLPYFHNVPLGFSGVFTFKQKVTDGKTIEDDIRSELLKNKDFPRSIKMSLYNEFLSYAESLGLHFEGLDDMGRFWQLLNTFVHHAIFYKDKWLYK